MIQNIDKLSTQHIKALIDMRNDEYTRVHSELYQLRKDLDQLHQELQRRIDASKTASKFHQHLINQEAICN